MIYIYYNYIIYIYTYIYTYTEKIVHRLIVLFNLQVFLTNGCFKVRASGMSKGTTRDVVVLDLHDPDDRKSPVGLLFFSRGKCWHTNRMFNLREAAFFCEKLRFMCAKMIKHVATRGFLGTTASNNAWQMLTGRIRTVDCRDTSLQGSPGFPNHQNKLPDSVHIGRFEPLPTRKPAVFDWKDLWCGWLGKPL